MLSSIQLILKVSILHPPSLSAMLLPLRLSFLYSRVNTRRYFFGNAMLQEHTIIETLMVFVGNVFVSSVSTHTSLLQISRFLSLWQFGENLWMVISGLWTIQEQGQRYHILRYNYYMFVVIDGSFIELRPNDEQRAESMRRFDCSWWWSITKETVRCMSAQLVPKKAKP